MLSIECYINTNPPYCSFYCIYLSVALSCRTRSFPLSLRVILRSTISFYPSLYHVVPDLFVVSLNMPCRSDLVCVCVPFNRIYRSVSPFRSCSCSSSSSPFDLSINPSLNCVVPDLFVTLYMSFRSCLCLCVVAILFVLFSVRPYLSIRLFIVPYWIFFPLFTCPSCSCSCSSSSSYHYSYQYSYSLSLMIVESILNLIWTHLSRGANVAIHISSPIYPPVLLFIECSTTYSTTTTNLCIRKDPKLDDVKATVPVL